MLIDDVRRDVLHLQLRVFGQPHRQRRDRRFVFELTGFGDHA
jgi:hypothetical protein